MVCEATIRFISSSVVVSLFGDRLNFDSLNHGGGWFTLHLDFLPYPNRHLVQSRPGDVIGGNPMHGLLRMESLWMSKTSERALQT